MFGRMSPVWPRLEENVRTGQCAYQLAFGRPIFEDLAHKPEDAAIFDAAMTSFHGGETDAVLNAYRRDRCSPFGRGRCAPFEAARAVALESVAMVCTAKN